MEKITLQAPAKYPSSSSSSCIPKKTTKPFQHLPYTQLQQCLPPKITTFNFTSISTNPSLFRLITTTTTHQVNCRRWDSNAENFRTNNFNSSSSSQDFVDDDDDDDDDDDEVDFLDEFIDRAWIFKVFKSYGWLLPAIITSLVLTTGVKAFLLTLAIPLGQTALSLAFQKVRERTQSKPKRRKGKYRKKTRGNAPKNVDLNEERRESGRGRKGKMGNETWFAGKNDVSDKNTKKTPSFGGWEELDMGSNAQFDKESDSDSTAERKRKIFRSKLRRREGRSDTPLLLRLLISVFPFLSSWTRML